MVAVCSAQTPDEVRRVPGFNEPKQWPGPPTIASQASDKIPNVFEGFEKTPAAEQLGNWIAEADFELKRALQKWYTAYIVAGINPGYADVKRISDVVIGDGRLLSLYA